MGKTTEKSLLGEIYEMNGKTWNITTLVFTSRNLKPFSVPIKLIDRSYEPFEIKTMADYIHHHKRVEAADLGRPIILSETGVMMDGRHRLAKAILLGRKTIKAVQFEEDPEPDVVEEEEE